MRDKGLSSKAKLCLKQIIIIIVVLISKEKEIT